ncbi:MAG TPA: sensor histidine kinase [Rhizomicrobium sp.]
MERLFERLDARSLAQIIVDTVREPLLVLDGDLNILFASSSFYRSFKTAPENARNEKLFALDNGAWDTPALRTLLIDTLAKKDAIEGFELNQEFPRIGKRILLLHLRKLVQDDHAKTTILIGFEDMTARRLAEDESASLKKQTDDLLQQKEMLLAEMQHRVVNSLQIIASILMMKARAVTSEETRQHLTDAHRRVMSVAAVQQHLHSASMTDKIDIGPYLTKLCESLDESMIGESRPAALNVIADAGEVVSADAVSLGLIITELVINALKYAFPGNKPDATVTVRYEVNGTNWKLSVSDNGVGRDESAAASTKGGLGTSLVNALASQLNAQVKIQSSSDGLSVSIAHATFAAKTPIAA